jgi:tetratricopeptide (TPR) repeat protein
MATVLRERGADPSRADATDCLVDSAATYAELRRIAPGSADEAVLASGVQREAALALEARARVAAKRGRGDEARGEMDRARGLMEAAYRSAVDAARQKPQDAAAVRMPGRLLVYFLQRDVMQAETSLRAAVKLSEDEVARARAAAAESGLDPAQREARARRVEDAESRLADAYQDLGVLHLELKGDPHGAKTWFEKALGTGPDPREDLRGPDGWIARCDAAIARGTDPRLSPENRWGSLP